MESGSKVHPLNKTDNNTGLEMKTGCSPSGADENKGNNHPAIKRAWDKDNPKQTPLEESLKPLFFWLSMCGLTWNQYCTTTSRRSLSFARRCYSIFVLVLFLGQHVVLSFCYFQLNQETGIVLIFSVQMLFVLAVFIWFCGLVFPKGISAFVKTFDQVRSCAPFKAPIGNVKKTLNIVTLALFFAIVIIISLTYGAALAGLYNAMPAYMSISLEERLSFQELKGINGMLSSTLALLAIHIVLILFVAVCSLLKREFDACSNGLQEMTAKTTNENVLDIFSKHHGNLRRLTEMTASFISLYVGGVYLYSIVVVCLVIYTCLFYPDSDWALNMNTLFLYLAVLHLVLVTYFGMKLNHAAHAPLTILHDLEGRTLNDRVVGLVILMMSKLSQDNIGISVMGLMIITRNTVFTIIGTLLTYIFIVVQFKPSSTSPLVPPGNSTVLP